MWQSCKRNLFILYCTVQVDKSCFHDNYQNFQIIEIYNIFPWPYVQLKASKKKLIDEEEKKIFLNPAWAVKALSKKYAIGGGV